MSAQSGAELEAIIVGGEGERLDFKSGFDSSDTGEWCELIKDIIAMANSGGGAIVIGLTDDGLPIEGGAASVLALDLADIANKLYRYTGKNFCDFSVERRQIQSCDVAVLTIGPVRLPIIFSVPGEYESPPGKKKSAFGKGTLYFRHGAKSEPGTTDDLHRVLERELERVRGFWLEGIAKVVEAPPDAEVHVVSPTVTLKSDAVQSIRLSASADGAEFRVVDNDQLYPYRAKELKHRLLEVLGSAKASPYDIQLVRKQFSIDDNPNFSFKGKYGTRQYSEAFVEWLAQHHAEDSQFFEKVRNRGRSTSRGKAPAP